MTSLHLKYYIYNAFSKKSPRSYCNNMRTNTDDILFFEKMPATPRMMCSIQAKIGQKVQGVCHCNICFTSKMATNNTCHHWSASISYSVKLIPNRELTFQKTGHMHDIIAFICKSPNSITNPKDTILFSKKKLERIYVILHNKE
jgi:hypothetical protein